MMKYATAPTTELVLAEDVSDLRVVLVVVVVQPELAVAPLARGRRRLAVRLSTKCPACELQARLGDRLGVAAGAVVGRGNRVGSSGNRATVVAARMLSTERMPGMVRLIRTPVRISEAALTAEDRVRWRMAR